MDSYDEPPPSSRKWFTGLVLLAQFLGLSSIILMAFWLGHYRGGFSWSGAPSLQFNYHPLFLVIGFIFLYGDGILSYRVFRTERKLYVKFLHGTVELLALLFASVGAKAAFDSHNLAKPPVPNLYTLHSWLGLSCLILFAVDWIFGFVTFLWPKFNPGIRKVLLPYHAFIGVALLTLAWATAMAGLNEKAIFTLKSNYATSAEGKLINVIGLVITSFVAVVLYIVTRPEYKRPPSPEERHIQLSDTSFDLEEEQ